MTKNSTKYSYKNGFIEAVVFIFYRDGKVLIEKRPNGPKHDGPLTYFFPSGKIEVKDHTQTEDYKVTALKREVSEEFDNQISFENYFFLGEVSVPAINIHFYVYLIDEFSGTMPKYTVEDGAKFAELSWIRIQDKEKYFIHDSAFKICDLFDNFLINLHKYDYQ